MLINFTLKGHVPAKSNQAGISAIPKTKAADLANKPCPVCGRFAIERKDRIDRCSACHKYKEGTDLQESTRTNVTYAHFSLTLSSVASSCGQTRAILSYLHSLALVQRDM